MSNSEIINLIVSIASSTIAVIAIFISIAAAHKQNKIALFEKRNNIVQILDNFYAFTTYCLEDNIINCVEFCDWFIHGVINKEKMESNEKIISELDNFSNVCYLHTSQAKYLFKKDIYKNVINIYQCITKLLVVMRKSIREKPQGIMHIDTNSLAKIVEFYEKIMPKINKIMKI